MQKDVQFCSEMIGHHLYKRPPRAGSLLFHEIDTIEGVLPGYFSFYAVAYPRRMAAPGKGRVTWPRQRTLRLTRPRFWRMLDLDGGSSDCGQSRHSFHREVPPTPSSIFSQGARNSRSFRETAERLRSRCFRSAISSERSQSPEWLAFDWPRPPPLLPVRRSRSIGRR